MLSIHPNLLSSFKAFLTQQNW